MKDEVDIANLARRVLSFFGLELRWIASAKQIWVIEAMTGDLVTACMERSANELFEQPLEAHFLESRCRSDDSEIAYRAFIESLGSIKKWSYGLDAETLEPKKILDNPFFNHRSLEEIAVKLDLLAEEKKREEYENEAYPRGNTLNCSTQPYWLEVLERSKILGCENHR